MVGAAVMDSLLRFYREFVPPERIHYETQVAAAHGFPTDGQGGACDIAQERRGSTTAPTTPPA